MSFVGDCVLTEGARCQNGACLDHECHCNDGYGGCGCSTPGNLTSKNINDWLP